MSTINLSISGELLKKVDRVAERENRSRSEVFREAVRGYVERRARWEAIFLFAERHGRGRGLREKDVERAIREARRA